MDVLKLYITSETQYLVHLVQKVQEKLNNTELQIINVNVNPELAERDNILVVPMLLFCKAGVNHVLIGRFSEEQLQSFFQRQLG